MTQDSSDSRKDETINHAVDASNANATNNPIPSPPEIFELRHESITPLGSSEALNTSWSRSPEVHPNILGGMVSSIEVVGEAQTSGMQVPEVYQNIVSSLEVLGETQKSWLPSPKFYQNMLGGMASSPEVFGVTQKSWLPAPEVYQNMIEEMLPTTAVSDFFEKLQSGLASNLSIDQAEIVKILSEHYLSEMSGKASEYSDELDAFDEEEIVKLFEDAEQPWSDPVHTEFIKFTAKIGEWLEEKYPAYEQRTLDTLRKFITGWFYTFLPLLIGHLGTLYGFPGLIVGSGIAQSVGMISQKRKRVIDLEMRKAQGLEKECGFCGVQAGEWCVTISGNKPGSAATALHKPRRG